MPEITKPPEPINSMPVDLKKHWSILDQTKAEFQKTGRPGIVILIGEDAAARKNLADFLDKQFATKFDINTPKPYLVIEHQTQAQDLYRIFHKAGFNVELIKAS
jgi:hypothetical protein